MPGALVLYVGQTGSNSCGTLRRRINDLISFSAGHPVGHRGGRLLWQLQDAQELQVAWKRVTNGDPRDVKKGLIQAFKARHKGRRPFANLQN